MSTPQGRANYFLTLAQIARAVQETINFGVIYAYLTCHNYAKQWVSGIILAKQGWMTHHSSVGGEARLLSQPDAGRAAGARQLHVGHCREDRCVSTPFLFDEFD